MQAKLNIYKQSKKVLENKIGKAGTYQRVNKVEALPFENKKNKVILNKTSTGFLNINCKSIRCLHLTNSILKEKMLFKKLI